MSAVNLETEGQLLESVSPPTLRYDDDANIYMNGATVEVAAADYGGGADDDVADDDGEKSGERGLAVSICFSNLYPTHANLLQLLQQMLIS